MEYSFLRYFLFFSYVIQRPILPQITLMTQRNAASCIISQTKGSCHIVETMQFMFMQQSCERTCSFIPCSSLMCERPFLPQITLITQRECSKLHYFADKRQLPHSADNAVPVYVTKLWGEHARSFLVTSLVLPLHVNGLCLPQITLITQRNAASCIISQTKDSCLIVESCSSCLCNKAVREHARSFLVTSLVLPLHVNGRFSRRSRWLRRGMQQAALLRREKTVAT